MSSVTGGVFAIVDATNAIVTAVVAGHAISFDGAGRGVHTCAVYALSAFALIAGITGNVGHAL